ncbi:hypothetical protein KKG31_06000 [Patescibacteria group bacterium]|nr:hypothetical protein [Patescibacteria group bacterium]MBU1758652.1 hypothetical protein [Patescibacteria group bacterium]
MNIKQRINARKVVLSYIYQKRFYHALQGQEGVAIESLFIDNIFKTDDKTFDKAKKEYHKDIKAYANTKVTKEDLTEFLDLFFDERDRNEIDYDYIFQVGTNF